MSTVTMTMPPIVETVPSADSSLNLSSIKDNASLSPSKSPSKCFSRSRHEKKVVLRNELFKYLPAEYRKTLPSVIIPLSVICGRDPNGDFLFHEEWMTRQVLPRVFAEMEDYFNCWEISIEAFLSALNGKVRGNARERRKALRKLIQFTMMDEEDGSLTHGELHVALEDFYHSDSTKIRLSMTFGGELTRVLRESTDASPRFGREYYRRAFQGRRLARTVLYALPCSAFDGWTCSFSMDYSSTWLW